MLGQAATRPVRVRRHAAVPAFVRELIANSRQALVLMPGQLHFGPDSGSQRTLPGSCVAIALGHLT